MSVSTRSIDAYQAHATWTVPTTNASGRAVLLLRDRLGHRLHSLNNCLDVEMAFAGDSILDVDYLFHAPLIPNDAINSAVAAYRWLLAQLFRGCEITMVGEGSGGMIAIGTVLRLCDAFEALPLKVILRYPCCFDVDMWRPIEAREGLKEAMITIIGNVIDADSDEHQIADALCAAGANVKVRTSRDRLSLEKIHRES